MRRRKLIDGIWDDSVTWFSPSYYQKWCYTVIIIVVGRLEEFVQIYSPDKMLAWTTVDFILENIGLGNDC